MVNPRSRPSPVVRHSSSSSSSSSQSSSSHPTRPRRRNSFASATASSLAHGGPSTFAMAPKQIHHRNRLPRPTDKENTSNTSPAATPTKKPQQKVLSPTPYWKVLEEKGGETSPRLTRSATKSAKKREAALIANMAALDDLESDEEPPTRREEGLAGLIGGGLRFESPSAFTNTGYGSASGYNSDYRQEREKEMKMRQRRRIDPSPVARGRKKLKTDNGAPPVAGLNSEEVRKVMTECLANDHEAKLASVLEEKGAIAAKYADLEAKYEKLLENAGEVDRAELERRMAEMEGQFNKERRKWEGIKRELDKKVLDQNEEIEEYVERVTELEQQCKANSETTSSNAELESKCKLMEAELEETKDELSTIKSEKANYELMLTETRHELEDTKRKMDEANERYAESERVHAAEDGAVADLQRLLTELREENGSIKEELSLAKAQAQTKDQQIRNLESSALQLQNEKDSALDQANEYSQHIKELEQALETTQQDLDSKHEELTVAYSKLEGVQSPRSRSALEEQHHNEVTMLHNRASTLESRLNDKEHELARVQDEKAAIAKEFENCTSENEELAMELEGAEKKLKESELYAQQTEAALKEQLNSLTSSLEAAGKENKKNDQLMEELAGENEELLKELNSTKCDLDGARDKTTDLGKQVEQLEANLSEESRARQQFEQQLVGAQNEIAGLEARVSSLYEELTTSQTLVAQHQQDKLESDKTLRELSEELSTVTAHLQQARAEISSLQAELQAKKHYVENFEKTERELLRENHVLNEIRRKLHNRVIQLSGNIRVFVRVRPLIESEILAIEDAKDNDNGGSSSRPSSRNGPPGSRPSSRGSMSSRATSKLVAKKVEVTTDVSPFTFPSITADRSSNNKNGHTSYSDITKQTLEIQEPYKDRGGLNPRQKKWKYGFDRVFNPNDSQVDVWEGACPLVQSCLDGFNVCMFAYGQTGSGKTFTMIGDKKNPGLIPRSVQMFFDTKADIEKKCQAQGQVVKIDIGVELLEVYNDEVRDLLSPNAGPNGKLVKVDVQGHEAVGNVVASPSSQTEVEKILAVAQSRRCVKATNSNAESSRSHMLFTIHFKVTSSTNDELNRNGCLHITDLAGSERLDKSGSYGQLLTEAKHINLSLHALTGVIEKLQEKSEHIPYRNSKLTYLLRNSLGGDSKTLAIVCCSPQQEHFQESHSSIRFAAKASKVELKNENEVHV